MKKFRTILKASQMRLQLYLYLACMAIVGLSGLINDRKPDHELLKRDPAQMTRHRERSYVLPIQRQVNFPMHRVHEKRVPEVRKVQRKLQKLNRKAPKFHVEKVLLKKVHRQRHVRPRVLQRKQQPLFYASPSWDMKRVMVKKVYNQGHVRPRVLHRQRHVSKHKNMEKTKFYY